MKTPRIFNVQTPFGYYTGTVREIVNHHNKQVDIQKLPQVFKVAISGFSRLATGRNKCGHYKHIRIV